jgi:fatty-acyl-CoA synthase
VVGLPDPRWIEAVTAVVVVKDRETLTTETVISHCAQSMAHFKVPKRVIFVDHLPRNPSGKLLKRELRRRYLEGETVGKTAGKHSAS